MRALQAFLVIMGVLIVAGFVVVGVEVWRRATDPDHPRAFGRAAETARATAGPVSLPPGAKLGDLVPVGGRLAYRVSLPDGGEQIHILDPRTGEVSTPVDVPGTLGAVAPRAP